MTWRSRATLYLDSLDEDQRTKSTYAFNDPELTRWHWTTPGNFPRNGLPLREMATDQRDAAFALLQTSLSAYGLQKSLDIISLQNDLGNDPELYLRDRLRYPGRRTLGLALGRTSSFAALQRDQRQTFGHAILPRRVAHGQQCRAESHGARRMGGARAGHFAG